jgi:hypothetical protein
MISRPDSPLGIGLLRGCALLFALLSFGLSLLVGMVDGDAKSKIELVLIYGPVVILLMGVAIWMYWWSFETTPDLVELPRHAQFFGLIVGSYFAWWGIGFIWTTAELIWKW